MKYVLPTAVALSAVSCVLSSANAAQHQDNWPYWYVAVHTDLAYIPDADLTIGGASAGKMALKNDATVGGAIGYRPHATHTFFDHTRYELEYTYHAYSFDTLKSGGASLDIDGSMHADSYMFNMYYDMPTGARISPYVGGGVGMAKWSMDSGTLSVDDTDLVFAYQFMVGLSYTPSTLRNVDWGIGYRYFTTVDPELSNAAGQKVDYSIDTHSLELLGRFHF